MAGMLGMTGFAHSKLACLLTPACGMAGTVRVGKGKTSPSEDRDADVLPAHRQQ